MRGFAAFFLGIVMMAILAADAHGDMKIFLRNGRSITADDCWDRGDRFVCSKLGGTIEIMKADIKDVKTVSSRARADEGLPAAPAEAEEEAPAEAGGETAEGGPAKKIVTRGEHPEEEKRLEEINQRKQELAAERDQLQEEQEALNAEIEKANALANHTDPAQRPTDEHMAELDRKTGELEQKINAFNDEVRALDEEERQIHEALEGGPKQQ